MWAVGAGTCTGDDLAAGPTAWRARARAWLRHDLVRFASRLEAGELSGVQVADALQAWTQDGMLAHVRDEAELARLPEDERADWRGFWEGVQRTIDGLR